MIYEDLCNQYQKRQKNSINYDELNAKRLLEEYLSKVGKSKPCYNTASYIDDFLYEYFNAKEKGQEEIFDLLLRKYNFKYTNSVHNSIYHILEINKTESPKINPTLFPGLYNINEEGLKYTIDTNIGRIEVYKADQIYLSSTSYHIFKKPLAGKCYDRTYEFLKENTDYKAILSYMPNFFYKGHYHVYLEKDDQVLDIAANALYTSRKFANKILCGEILAKLSYKQVEQEFKNIKKTIPEVGSASKLLTLSLYYDIKRNE